MKNSNLVELGVARSAHGIKGAASIVLYNPQDSILKSGMRVTLLPFDASSSLSASGSSFTISKIQFGNKTIIYFEEVQDRNQLEMIFLL